MNRVSIHLVEVLVTRELRSFRRDELRTLLNEKAKVGLSFSAVDRLRWDIKQIFDMAVSEDNVERNPPALLYTPRDAGRAERRVMNIPEVQTCFAVLEQRERQVVKLAILTGMQPGEIFALTCGRLNSTYIDIRQRIYRGAIDAPRQRFPFEVPRCPKVSFGRSRLGGLYRLLRTTTHGCFRPSG